MSELINRLNQYRSMGDNFYPEDILVIEDVWELVDEIKRLKEEYMILQNASDEVEEEKGKEIERLNNIINGLEKWLKEEVERLMTIEQSNNVIFLIGAYTEVLDKLQELKGSDKE